jgi:GNAT superfamily N-acetyltransferase
MAIADGGKVGLFDLVTDANHRREGYGQQLVNGLLGWGHHVGAREAYLQVVHANQPAWRLYEKLGFASGYDYRYRVKESIV